MKFHANEPKKETLKIQMSRIAISVLNQFPISAVFPIVWLAGDPKTALTGDPLYMLASQVSLIGESTWFCLMVFYVINIETPICKTIWHIKIAEDFNIEKKYLINTKRTVK